MEKTYAENKSLFFILIFTIISSAIAYMLVVRAYDHVFALSTLQIIE